MDSLVNDLAVYKTWVNKKRNIKRLKVNDVAKQQLLHQNDLDYVKQKIESLRQQYGNMMYS